MITKEQAQEAFNTIKECKKILNEYQKQLLAEVNEIKKADETHGPYLAHEKDDVYEFVVHTIPYESISTRVINLIYAWHGRFRDSDYKTMGDFMRLTDKDILQWRGAGAQVLAEINKVRSEIVLI